MSKQTQLRVAAFQAPDIHGNIDAAVSVVVQAAHRAEEAGAEVVLFPECYLQGYVLDEASARSRALRLRSPAFEDILHRVSKIQPTLIVGLIEEKDRTLFNTAVVIKAGRLAGAYRKVNIHSKELIFAPGDSYPVFEVNDVRVGINICYDARFQHSAAKLTKNGARVLFYPLNNRLPHAVAQRWRERHIEFLRARAQQTGAFVVSADVVATTDTDTAFGCTVIVSPAGEVLQQAPHLESALIIDSLTMSL